MPHNVFAHIPPEGIRQQEGLLFRWKAAMLRSASYVGGLSATVRRADPVRVSGGVASVSGTVASVSGASHVTIGGRLIYR